MHKLTAEHLRKALDGKLIRDMCERKNAHCIHADALAGGDNFEEFVDKAKRVYAKGEYQGMAPEFSVMFMGLHIGYAAALIQFGLEEAVFSEDDKAKTS